MQKSGLPVTIPLLLLKQGLIVHQDGALTAGIEMQIANGPTRAACAEGAALPEHRVRPV